MTAALLGAVCSTRDARGRLLGRLARGTRRVLEFGARPAAAGECGFLCAPAIFETGGEPAPLCFAGEGQLRTSDGSCLEGAAAAAHAMAGFRRGGAVSFEDLGGNHAFALVDGCGEVWLRRDVAGCKPLFLSPAQDGWVFGTSALEVARVAQGRPCLSRSALHDFLRTGRAGLCGETPLQEVRPLPAGHAVALRARGVERALDQRPAAAGASLTLDAAAPLLWQRLCDSVAAIGDAATTASALSGGLDSSAILAARRATSSAAGRSFSFAHGHPDLPAAWNERHFAEQASAHCGADTHYVALDAAQLPALFDRACAEQDFPFGSPVVLAQAHLFRRAAEAGVTRLLSGHGPDTLFGGGTSHLIARAADLLAGGHVAAACRMLAGGRRYAEVPLPRLALAALRASARRPASGSRLHRELQAQLYDTIVPVSLITEECSARACGIDNRQPFLERGVLALAGELSPEAVLPADGETKAVLRRALAARLPPAILARRRAIGFAVPALPWLLELESWAASRWRAMARLPGVVDAPYGHWQHRLRRKDGSAWEAAFAVWRRLILAGWMQAHDVRLEAA